MAGRPGCLGAVVGSADLESAHQKLFCSSGCPALSLQWAQWTSPCSWKELPVRHGTRATTCHREGQLVDPRLCEIFNPEGGELGSFNEELALG